MRRKKWLLISILAAVVLLAFVGCQAQTFTVAFDTDGGSAVSSAIVDSGSLAIRPADPSKAGKNFGGWYKEKECINKFYFNEPILSDMTLFAKWVDQITYTVNFLRRKL